jgi:hypothetical protein
MTPGEIPGEFYGEKVVNLPPSSGKNYQVNLPGRSEE